MSNFAEHYARQFIGTHGAFMVGKGKTVTGTLKSYAWTDFGPIYTFSDVEQPCADVRCAYCASVVRADRCDSCGAPKP